MICDQANNNEHCNYDDGDCCQGTCKATCAAKGISDANCLCGQELYDCISDNAPCFGCVHGKCETDMNKCYSDDEFIKLAVKGCNENSFSQGDSNTIDYYCGKDPDKTIVHYSSTPNYHFPGCGIKDINCTESPCCEVVKLNQDTYDNCDNVKKNRYVWDPTKKAYSLQFISCIEYFKDCFHQNARGTPRGQCCQCEEGWGGTYCDVPLCAQCSYGVCIDQNTCVCDSDYTGPGCNKPICNSCVHGVCTSPNVCECFYGYQGEKCDQYITYPTCAHGSPGPGDTCVCESGFTGKLCEIKICDQTKSDCDFCDDKGQCYADLSKKCESISSYCIECDTKNERCTKCSNGFIVDDVKGSCVSVSTKLPNCYKGDGSTCTECLYPYVLKDNKCISGGMIELAQNHFTVDGDEDELVISVYRYFGKDEECSVNFEIVPNDLFNKGLNFLDNPLNTIANDKGVITFGDGETEKTITLKMYHYRMPNTDKKCLLFISIFNPRGSCIIGEIMDSTIEVYNSDEISMDDAASKSYATLQLTANINGDYEIDSTFSSVAYSVQPYDKLIPNIQKYFAISYLVTKRNSKVKMGKIAALNYDAGANKFVGELLYNDVLAEGFLGKVFFPVLICMNESPLYKMKFYNYAGFIENDFPFYLRYAKSPELIPFYGGDAKTYFSVNWEFYLKTSLKVVYMKVTIREEDQFSLKVSDETSDPTKVVKSEGNTTHYYAIATDEFYRKFNLLYIHTKNKILFEVLYSEDDKIYEATNSNLNFYSCNEIRQFPLNIS